MRLFFDSSALAKRYIEEDGSDKVETLCSQARVLGISIICPPEIISAFCRLMREDKLVNSQYVILKQALSADVAEAKVVNITPELISIIIAVLEKTSYRTLDAIHIASAIQWKADSFVSSDLNQITAAEKFGLKIIRI